MSETPSAFTGRSRKKRTKRSVKFADWLSQALITVGGIGTIIAVATVALLLIVVAVPLFRGADLEAVEAAEVTRTTNSAPAIAVAVDEYLTTGWTIDADGLLSVFRADTGETITTRALFEGRTPTTWSAESRRGVLVAGFEDGTVQVVGVRFETRFMLDRGLPETLLELAPGDVLLYEGAMVERTVEGQFRRQEFIVELKGEPLDLGDGPVLLLDHSGPATDLHATALIGADGDPGGVRLVRFTGTEEEDMFSGETTLSLAGPEPMELPTGPGTTGAPSLVTTAYAGTNRYVTWDTGTIARYARGADAPSELIDASGAPITAMQMLLGERTIIVGRGDGTVEGWFPSRDDAATAPDGFALKLTRTLSSATGSPVRTIGNATRSRMFITGHDDGTLSTYYMVSGDRLAEVQLPEAQPVSAVAVSPKEDAVLVATAATVSRFAFEPMYPEASARTLFTPLWYEGYPESDFVWQSSSASDESEPKLSLIPLIFGTLKATFYSMIFGAPVALLAAIYTSEFLNPKVKAWVKPSIEMMASLPSVVLGFLAALVFAPVIERIIPATLAVFITVPFTLVLAAFLWQLLPQSATIRLSHLRIACIGLVLPLGVLLAIVVGPIIETTLFAGSLRLWLNGLQNPDMTGPGVAGALGGWVVLLLPLSAIVVGWLISRVIGPRLFARRTGGRREAATRDLLKFALGAAAAILVAFGAGAMLSGAGFDVRGNIPGLGSFADTFDQRNSLVVGFVMGFAIIPIIYTIADDALSTVPEHLRGASLGAGATPWQTTVRIVIPTAMSGLFSAVMIGLGRAVGETMIVLMALGNTPVMNVNAFEGARTLAANLAVEMPEAPQGGGHYRVLFLSALVLFIMTFALNTAAESIRLRFRKRAYQL